MDDNIWEGVLRTWFIVEIPVGLYQGGFRERKNDTCNNRVHVDGEKRDCR